MVKILKQTRCIRERGLNGEVWPGQEPREGSTASVPWAWRGQRPELENPDPSTLSLIVWPGQVSFSLSFIC